MEEVTLIGENTGDTTSVWQVNTDDHHLPFMRMGYGLDLVLDIPGEDDEGVRAWMRTGAKIVMCLRLYYIDFVAQGRPPLEWPAHKEKLITACHTGNIRFLWNNQPRTRTFTGAWYATLYLREVYYSHQRRSLYQRYHRTQFVVDYAGFATGYWDAIVIDQQSGSVQMRTSEYEDRSVHPCGCITHLYVVAKSQLGSINADGYSQLFLRDGCRALIESLAPLVEMADIDWHIASVDVVDGACGSGCLFTWDTVRVITRKHHGQAGGGSITKQDLQAWIEKAKAEHHFDVSQYGAPVTVEVSSQPADS